MSQLKSKLVELTVKLNDVSQLLVILADTPDNTKQTSVKGRCHYLFTIFFIGTTETRRTKLLFIAQLAPNNKVQLSVVLYIWENILLQCR